MNQKILLVDDESNVLQGFRRHLRKRFDLELAVGGEAAIESIKTQGPFAAIVSDMQMPGMSGVELLQEVRQRSPQTVRMMLTGNADQKTAADAVNEGSIFRFLNKPCPPDQLAQALDAALEQYRLITAEAELLSKTLAGSVRVLTQVLSMAMPEAFGMTQEARKLASGIGERLDAGPVWQLEIAAMLMRIGCVSLPKDLLIRYLSDDELSSEDQELIAETPRLGHDLVAEIPRLKPVSEVIAHTLNSASGDTPMASRILRAVGDYQRFRTSRTNFETLKKLEADSAYDPAVVDALAEVINENSEMRQVSVAELEEGMLLETHIEDGSGMVLLAAGVEVHDAMIQKLAVFQKSGRGVREPIAVRVLGQPAVKKVLTASAERDQAGVGTNLAQQQTSVSA